jgi:DNA-binding NarL/FixJ family response regulator
MPTEPHDIIIVEDMTETRAWLRDLLGGVFPEADIQEAAMVAQARTLLSNHRFDLALIDLQLPDGSGIDVLREIRQKSPTTYCVVATIFDDDRHLFDALRAGAQGYLLKDHDDARIASQLRGILLDQPPLSPAIARRVLEFFSLPESAVPEEQLSDRELEVLSLIARGLRLKEVAVALEISVHTVGDHVKHIYHKLQVSNRAEATLHAVRLGLIPPTN